MLYVQRTTGDAHLSLSGRTLVVTPDDGGARRERKLADADEVTRVLAEDFALRLPEGARLPA
ncbi:arylamine N-acetyltransferase [Streptomyces sp. NPDC097595]|uniref:arylamine N-acetyltransferase n=1 Tax=Streptomyces sp. NPDC097595 TaxID=3366090 RepID=UPI00382C0CEA